MLLTTVKVWIGLSVVVAGVAYYHRPRFPETANNLTLKQITGIYMNFIDVVSKIGKMLGFNPINITRAMLSGPILKLDKPESDIEEYTTTLDGVEVMIFRPAGTQDKLLPGIIHYHGGGWVVLTPAAYAKVLRGIVRETQSVIMSVNYRRSPEYLYPIPLEDCLRATRYFLKNADEYGVDKNRVGIKGDSAGGNLAMAAALRLTQDDDDSLPALRFMSLDYPALQMLDLNLPSYREYENGPCFVNKKRMIVYWILYSVGMVEDMDYLFQNLGTNNHTTSKTKTSELAYEYVDPSLVPNNLPSGSTNYEPWKTENEDVIKRMEKFATDIYFSPLVASDKALSKLPPTRVVNAEFDVLRDDGFILVERLRKVGVPVEHAYYPSEEHGFINLVDLDPLATEETVSFGKYFKEIVGST